MSLCLDIINTYFFHSYRSLSLFVSVISVFLQYSNQCLSIGLINDKAHKRNTSAPREPCIDEILSLINIEPMLIVYNAEGFKQRLVLLNNKLRLFKNHRNCSAKQELHVRRSRRHQSAIHKLREHILYFSQTDFSHRSP